MDSDLLFLYDGVHGHWDLAAQFSGNGVPQPVTTSGNLAYLRFSADGQHKKAEIWRNDRVWQQPAPGDERFGYNSRGIGMDVEGGTVPEFHRFEQR